MRPLAIGGLVAASLVFVGSACGSAPPARTVKASLTSANRGLPRGSVWWHYAPSTTTTTAAPTTTTAPRPVQQAVPTRIAPVRSANSIEACIVARESGGNYYPHDNPTHFGKYQYDRQTWAAHGGNPADWGTASPAEQERVFRNGVSKYGYSAWRSYDGC